MTPSQLADAPLGPGDLLIISGNNPLTEPPLEHGTGYATLKDYQTAAATDGFTLSPTNPTTAGGAQSGDQCRVK